VYKITISPNYYIMVASSTKIIAFNKSTLASVWTMNMNATIFQIKYSNNTLLALLQSYVYKLY
jgi:hypothetical protein